MTKDVNLRKPPEPMPKSRLIPITVVIDSIKTRSEDRLDIFEITDAIWYIMKGDFMIYDGHTSGLAIPIDGNPLAEDSGWNRRNDIVCELFNSRYWLNGGGVFRGYDGSRIQAQECLILKEDAEKISEDLWNYFYPPEKSELPMSQKQDDAKSNRMPVSVNGRDHVSDKLAYLIQASEKFWANAERSDRDTHPNNEVVEKWLIDRGYSQTLAAKAATIIRPEWAETGRKPNK